LSLSLSLGLGLGGRRGMQGKRARTRFGSKARRGEGLAANDETAGRRDERKLSEAARENSSPCG
jgi:hypothetical protein